MFTPSGALTLGPSFIYSAALEEICTDKNDFFFHVQLLIAASAPGPSGLRVTPPAARACSRGSESLSSIPRPPARPAAPWSRRGGARAGGARTSTGGTRAPSEVRTSMARFVICLLLFR